MAPKEEESGGGRNHNKNAHIFKFLMTDVYNTNTRPLLKFRYFIPISALANFSSTQFSEFREGRRSEVMLSGGMKVQMSLAGLVPHRLSSQLALKSIDDC